MSKKSRWSWSSALIGAAAATATAAVLSAKPKDPTFHLISINLTSFKLNPPKFKNMPKGDKNFNLTPFLPVISPQLILTVHVTNPNIAPIRYRSTSMSIFYNGTLLGSADVKAGSQSANSCQTLRLPARLNGAELAHHAGRFIEDVKKREMVLEAEVDLVGTARMLWRDHRVRVRVDSHVIVDPVFLDVIGQENRSKLQVSYL